MAERASEVRFLLKVKVVPGASRTRVVGWLGEELKVTVAAVAESGKANAAVEELLAGVLGVGRREVRVVGGLTRPRKVVEILGLDAGEVGRRLAAGGWGEGK